MHGDRLYKPGETVHIDRSMTLHRVWSNLKSVKFFGADLRTPTEYFEETLTITLPGEEKFYNHDSWEPTGWTDGQTTFGLGETVTLDKRTEFRAVKKVKNCTFIIDFDRPDIENIVYDKPWGTTIVLPEFEDDRGRVVEWNYTSWMWIPRYPGEEIYIRGDERMLAKWEWYRRTCFGKIGRTIAN